MGFGASTFILAAGAIMRFGFTRTTWGEVRLDNIGNILMIVGALGLFVSFVAWAMWNDERRSRRGGVVVQRGPDVVVDRRPDVVVDSRREIV
jgi:hypothetical protein